MLEMRDSANQSVRSVRAPKQELTILSPGKEWQMLADPRRQLVCQREITTASPHVGHFNHTSVLLRWIRPTTKAVTVWPIDVTTVVYVFFQCTDRLEGGSKLMKERCTWRIHVVSPHLETWKGLHF